MNRATSKEAWKLACWADRIALIGIALVMAFCFVITDPIDGFVALVFLMSQAMRMLDLATMQQWAERIVNPQPVITEQMISLSATDFNEAFRKAQQYSGHA